MFFRRGVADDDPWLRPKLWLFSIGAILALLGMGLENDLLIGAAALLLVAGLGLRFLKPRRTERDELDAEGGEAGNGLT